jgi:hypothetical protein
VALRVIFSATINSAGEAKSVFFSSPRKRNHATHSDVKEGFQRKKTFVGAEEKFFLLRERKIKREREERERKREGDRKSTFSHLAGRKHSLSWIEP